MAIYHANIKSFSRGKGDSSIAAAAYRAGVDLVDTRSREVHRYSSRRGVVSHFMLSPVGAPSWCNDVQVFWDANEAWESRLNARVARELEVSIPSELNEDQRQSLALKLGQLLVDRYKAVVLVAIHLPSQEGDSRNHHVHLLMSAREVGKDGFGLRAGSEFDARGGRGADEVRLVRGLISQVINESLASAGVEVRVDHRSLHDQAKAAEAVGDHGRAAELFRPPPEHVGKASTAARRLEVAFMTRSEAGSPPELAKKSMAEAVERFRRNRLASISSAHGMPPAREGDTETITTGTARSCRDHAKDSSVSIAAQAPSQMALQLSRRARISKSSGQDAALLDEQAQLVEEWLVVQCELARTALESLHSVPGLRVEQEMKDAMESALVRRVDVYASKLFFFEDSERLTASIRDYAEALRRPHEARERVERARAKLSERMVESRGLTDPSLAGAKRALWNAKTGVSARARVANDRRINEARAAMVDATSVMERHYYITLPHKEHSPSYDINWPDDGERKSDSNRQQLTPSTNNRRNGRFGARS